MKRFLTEWAVVFIDQNTACAKHVITKTMISELFFDEKVVSSLKESNLNNDILYSFLYSGKITMQEYLQLCK
jgi:hypothetical protein